MSLQILKLATDGITLVGIFTATIHSTPVDSIKNLTDEQIAIVESALQTALEQLGFVFCDCSQSDQPHQPEQIPVIVLSPFTTAH